MDMKDGFYLCVYACVCACVQVFTCEYSVNLQRTAADIISHMLLTSFLIRFLFSWTYKDKMTGCQVGVYHSLLSWL